MYRLRSVTIEDLDDIYELSNFVFFINLPSNKEDIEKKIKSSIKSFESPSKDFFKNYYMFVLEDYETNKVIGVSMIHAQHGTEDEPHFYLRVGQEHKFSQSINTGFIHGTLKLGYDTDGPTEIGGLVLHPDYRGKPGKLGKQLSFSRFLYMGINPDRFKSTIHSELMPPLDKDGNSPLWEAIGRRFLNMDYNDADVLSRKNKEFILSLFPSDTIYETLLPINARNAIGKFASETAPVAKMLKSIGFNYINEVDPFDGGPHFQCKLKDISLIKEMISGEIELSDNIDQEKSTSILLSIPSKSFQFEAIKINALIQSSGPNAVSKIIIDSETAKKFNLQNNVQVNAIFF